MIDSVLLTWYQTTTWSILLINLVRGTESLLVRRKVLFRGENEFEPHQEIKILLPFRNSFQNSREEIYNPRHIYSIWNFTLPPPQDLKVGMR